MPTEWPLSDGRPEDEQYYTILALQFCFKNRLHYCGLSFAPNQMLDAMLAVERWHDQGLCYLWEMRDAMDRIASVVETYNAGRRLLEMLGR